MNPEELRREVVSIVACNGAFGTGRLNCEDSSAEPGERRLEEMQLQGIPLKLQGWL